MLSLKVSSFLGVALDLFDTLHCGDGGSHEVAVVAHRPVAPLFKLKGRVHLEVLARGLAGRFCPLDLARVALLCKGAVALFAAKFEHLGRRGGARVRVAPTGAWRGSCGTRTLESLRIKVVPWPG